MPRFLLTDHAKADIREIIDYLHKRSPQAATNVRHQLQEAMRLLASFPHLGHKRADLTDQPLRFWSVYSYLIAYSPDPQPIQIIRVLHGSRDLRNLLKDLKDH
jgi:plasmid stabilization system protein ParE